MGASYSTSTIFKGVDRMSPVFNKMGKRASSFGANLKANLASSAIQGGLRLLKSGIVGITREFIGFEGALISSGAKFKGLNVATEEGRAQLELLGQTAREVGATTIFSATEAAKGLDFLAMAGFSATEAMTALPAVTNLAVVANLDLATATDIASDSLGAFGLDVEDLTRLNDVFAKTMTTSNTDMVNMFEAIKKGAPAFTSAGQSLESFNALLGTMANSGVKGSEAGTALRNVMLRLANPTDAAAGVIEKLGVKTQDQFGNFRDVIDILGDFETGLEGMGSAQRTAALAQVFGARTVTGINLLLQEGSEGLREYRNELLNASGASGIMAGVIGGSLGNRLKGLKSAVIEAGFTFVAAFQEKAGAGISRLTEMIRGIDLSGFAEKLSTGLDKMIDNLPIIKQQFIEMLPKIKEFAGEIKAIVGYLSDGIQKLSGITDSKLFTAVEFLLPGGAGRVAERHLEKKRLAEESPNQAEANATNLNLNQIFNASGALDSFTSETSFNGAPAVKKEMLGGS